MKYMRQKYKDRKSLNSCPTDVLLSFNKQFTSKNQNLDQVIIILI